MNEHIRNRITQLKRKLSIGWKTLGLGTLMMVSLNNKTSVFVSDNIKNYYDVPENNIANNITDDFTVLDIETLTEYISTHNLGELRDCGLLSYESFENYNFSKDDFQQMQYGKTGLNVANRLKKTYKDRVPQRKCLAALRQNVANETGVNILTVPRKCGKVTSYPACNWGRGITNVGSVSPMIYLGAAKAKNDDGNIPLMDLLYFQGIAIMAGGKVQPNGHVCMNIPKYDKDKNYIGTDARCDGNESLQNILSKKMNTRYGDEIQVYAFYDDVPSSSMASYLANEIVEKALEENKILSFENEHVVLKNLDRETVPFNISLNMRKQNEHT